MGQSISEIVSGLEGKDQQEKEANDALNALMQVATDRQTLFYEHISSPAFDPGLVPMHKVIYKYQNIQCSVGQNPDGITKEITDTMGNFIDGDVAKGVTNIVNSCLGFLFGNYAANASSTTMYTLTTGSLGGLARIDTDLYSYEYTSSTLSTITKNVLVCSIVISSADVTGLNKNDMSAIVQTLYGGSAPADQVKIRDQLWEAVQESEGKLAAKSLRSLDTTTFKGPITNVDFKNLARPVLGAIEPAGPDDPQHGPNEPSKPIEPVHPVEPIEPIHPVEPVTPGNPSVPKGPVEIDISIVTLPGKADTTMSLVEVFLAGYLKGKVNDHDYDINCTSPGTDNVVVSVVATGSPQVDDGLEATLKEAMEQFMMTKNCPAKSWEIRDAISPHPAPEPKEPDETDIHADILKTFKQLNAKADAWQVTLQLISYIVKSLGDFEDLAGIVNASTVAGAIYDCVKDTMDAQVITAQAHAVQWLLGGLTYYAKNDTLPSSSAMVVPLSLPGARSDGAEKLLSSLMASCSLTAQQPTSPGVVMFVNFLTSAKVVKPSLR
ncbi:hypothetical protein EVG20_g4706 [Dentipellis fragilis]|uniref:Uncharacterized protein n=1 Tax=Dentipellis fragilis TaxID=205917 RepID=A0A4Y9YVB7_9AGAM|nr:hypothetical protein EVG20_g4706 [Dentipellis fragilis]